MGIYSKKRKKSGVRILLFSLFFLSIFLFFGYYFFYPNNFKIILNEYLQVKSIEPQEVVEELGVTDKTGDYKSEIEIDLSNYVEADDLDKHIKEFVQNNPEFIIDVLRKYQDEQNQKKKKKISQLNNLECQVVFFRFHRVFF